MSLVQAILIAIIAGVSRCEGDWLGECKLREPIVTGFLVGLVLGDVKTGLIIGAELQLMWMGAVGIGPVAQLDIGIGGTIGTAVAITTGTGAETAILCSGCSYHAVPEHAADVRLFRCDAVSR